MGFYQSVFKSREILMSFFKYPGIDHFWIKPSGPLHIREMKAKMEFIQTELREVNW